MAEQTTSNEKMLMRVLKLGKKRPRPPRSVRFQKTGSLLVWEPPADTRNVTGFIARVYSRGQTTPQETFHLSLYTTSLHLTKGTHVFLTSLNENTELESSPVDVFYTACLGNTEPTYLVDRNGDQRGFLGVLQEAAKAVTNAVNNGAGLIRLSIPSHGWVSRDTIMVDRAVGGVFAATGSWIVDVIDPNTVDLTTATGTGLPSVFSGTYTSGGTAARYYAGILVEQIGVGGATFALAKLRAWANGDLEINGATFALDLNNVKTTIDHSLFGGLCVGLRMQDTHVGSSAESQVYPGTLRVTSDGSNWSYLTSGALRLYDSVTGHTAMLWAPGGDYELDIAGNKVVGARVTNWGAPTGTATRTTFATTTVTLAQLAERVHALIDDLTSHGLIGA